MHNKCLVVGGILIFLASSSVQAGAVIVAKDSPISALDMDQCKRIFLGREKQIGGLDITVVYQKDGDARNEFEDKVVEKKGAELTQYWTKMIFTGRAASPVEVMGDAGARAKVSSTPGAIGFVSDSGVDSSVKVVFKY